MRQFADVKSPIIRDLRAGEVLIILAEEEHWTKAETTDGYIGYVENAVIGAEVKEQDHVNRIGEHTSISYDFPINMVFHQTDSQASNNALEKSLEGTHGINIIAPTWFFMDDVNGSFTDLTSSAYVEKAHSLGMKVWAVANDFDGAIASPQDTKALMEKTAVRQQLAENIVNRTLECGADGINLDFENVRKESAQTYLMFVREMSVYCRKAGLVLSIDSYVPQPYNLYLNRTEQAEAVDYIVTMAYDEHTSGSPEAGSVSSISWVKQAAEGTRAEVPDGKIIIALPFYTRIWETDNSSEKPATRAMGMREAEEVLKEFGMKTVWDETTQQDYAELTSGLKRQIWLENARSLRAKLELLKNYQFAGTAAWKLGLETPDIWDLLSEYHGS